ncbi:MULTISPECIES: S8 family serine peptidase [Halolamina]|uniref:Subtilase family protein n=1 Tax=Halolamina pelagica TaxID=699431 RepID=A0A1I5MAA2_9EURY|nr:MULTISPECIES: S8 family serine peptidase [Halolamina]NHX35929.1 S8 family serine peptidase [Halolamina sp. R1-12]SFP06277.1 Subtilase family protein [Halolamina pelagica]
MRIETAATLFVVVIVVSSTSFAVPVGSSSAVRDRPIGALSSDGGPADEAAAVDPPPEATDSATLSGFDAVHETGVTGDDVRVGIVGSQFAPDHSRISDAVAATRRFSGRSSGLFADTSHDTAIAEIVSRTAPDAELYLASIGPDGGHEAYARAVSWLRERNVDVVVDAGSYFPSSAAGMAELNRVASAAARNDTAFVTSAGNYADRHWHGNGSEGWVAFANDTRYNTLGGGEIAGAVSLRLYWQGDADYDLYLYRAVDGEDQLIAKSETNATGRTEAIDATVPGGRYYVAVRGGPDANGTGADLFSFHHELGISSDSGGMVAPATAEGVIAVGAADAVSGERRPYSSTGPALDISAPDGADTSAAGELYGSSAAAPLVAGTLTLMLAANESLTPAEAQAVLRDTAVRHEGELYLDTAGAVQAVSSRDPAIEDAELDWFNGTLSEDG